MRTPDEQRRRAFERHAAELKAHAESSAEPAFEALAALLETTDRDALFRRLYPAGTEGVPTLYGQKYLELKRFLQRHIGNVKAMGFDKAAPFSFLDIGAGAGLFCFVAKVYGHDPVALEPSRDFHSQPAVDFGAMTEWLSIPLTQQSIGRRTPIALDAALKNPDGSPRTFDRITANRIMFNYYDRGGSLEHQWQFWEADDYRFFFNDLKRFLKPGGRVLLQFNGEPFGEPSSARPPSVARYYHSLGRFIEPLVVAAPGRTLELDLTREPASVELELPDDSESTRAATSAGNRKRNAELRRKRRQAAG